MPSASKVPPMLCSLFTLESPGPIASMAALYCSGSPSQFTSQAWRHFPTHRQSPAVAVAGNHLSPGKTALSQTHLEKSEAHCFPVPWRDRGLWAGLHAANIYTFAPLSLEIQKHMHASWEERLRSWNKNSIFKGLISFLFLVISALH